MHNFAKNLAYSLLAGCGVAMLVHCGLSNKSSSTSSNTSGTATAPAAGGPADAGNVQARVGLSAGTSVCNGSGSGTTNGAGSGPQATQTIFGGNPPGSTAPTIAGGLAAMPAGGSNTGAIIPGTNGMIAGGPVGTNPSNGMIAGGPVGTYPGCLNGVGVGGAGVPVACLLYGSLAALGPQSVGISPFGTGGNGLAQAQMVDPTSGTSTFCVGSAALGTNAIIPMTGTQCPNGYQPLSVADAQKLVSDAQEAAAKQNAAATAPCP